MKFLFLKQHMDLVGPRTTYSYNEDLKPQDLLSHFKSKTSMYETLLYYKCDFVILTTRTNSPWLQTLASTIDGYQEYFNTNTRYKMEIDEIPFEKYDVVITHDPILGHRMSELKIKYPKTVFAYILAEHTSWQVHPLGIDYDLFLDHTQEAVDEVIRLPQAINYFFPRTPDIVSKLYDVERKNLFIDYRSYGHFQHDTNNIEITKGSIDEINKKIDLDLEIEPISDVSLKPYMFTTEDNEDSINYYKKMNRSKYFISIANRVGQGAWDAASAGCLVIGNYQSKLHRFLCHRDCLMEPNFTLEDVVNKVKHFEKYPKQFKKVMEYQAYQINKYGVDLAKNIFEKAIKIKRGKNNV